MRVNIHSVTANVQNAIQTLIKKGAQARQAGCNMYLYCTPEIMDFRWNSFKLLGENTAEKKVQAECPTKYNKGKIGEISPMDVDRMWKYSTASCDSTVTRENIDGTGEVGKQDFNYLKKFF